MAVWLTFHCICYKLDKLIPEENKTRLGIFKNRGAKRTTALVFAAPCNQKLIIFPNNIVFIAQKLAAYRYYNDSKRVVLEKDTTGTRLNWWSALPLFHFAIENGRRGTFCPPLWWLHYGYIMARLMMDRRPSEAAASASRRNKQVTVMQLHRWSANVGW